MTVSGICLSSLRAMPRRPSRRNSLYWDHKTVYCLRISFDSQNLVITWPQHCERWTRSRINGWLSEVNRAKGFSIKAKRVKGFLGKHWTKKGSGGVGEEKVWLTLKNEGLRGLLIITGGVGVWTSPTSWAFIVGLTGDSRTYAFLPFSTTWATSSPQLSNSIVWWIQAFASRPLSRGTLSTSSTIVPTSSSISRLHYELRPLWFEVTQHIIDYPARSLFYEDLGSRSS